jgi:hypothetical protein
MFLTCELNLASKKSSKTSEPRFKKNLPYYSLKMSFTAFDLDLDET